VAIEYHTRYPYAGDPYYQANPTEQMAREQEAGIHRVPSFLFDGIAMPAAFDTGAYQATYDLRLAMPSRVALDLYGVIDPSSRTGSLTAMVEPEMALPGAWALVVAVVESPIDVQSPNGIDPQRHVFRRFLGGVEGMPVDLGGAAGARTVVLPFAIDDDWVLENIEFVAFVENAATGEIEQGAVLHLTGLVGVEPTTWGRLKASFRTTAEPSR